MDSGEAAPIRVNSEDEVADWIHVNGALGLSSGAIVAVPNPEPADKKLVDDALETALCEVKERGISGKAATPYLLSRMNKLTHGESLRSNIALVRNNAAVGARIAVARAVRQHREYSTVTPRAIVAGGATIDVICTGTSGVQIGTSNQGIVDQSHGGAGRNVCETIGRLMPSHSSPYFLSTVGDDAAGREIVSMLNSANVDVSGVSFAKGRRTGMYNAILDDKGDLVAAVADMEIMNRMDGSDVRRKLESVDFCPELAIVDGNLSSDAIASIAKKWNGVRLWFEPTSVAKSVRVTHDRVLPYVELISPNGDELRAIHAALGGDGGTVSESAAFVAQKMAAAASSSASRFVLVTMGDQGVLLAEATANGDTNVIELQPPGGKVQMKNLHGGWRLPVRCCSIDYAPLAREHSLASRDRGRHECSKTHNR